MENDDILNIIRKCVSNNCTFVFTATNPSDKSDIILLASGPLAERIGLTEFAVFGYKKELAVGFTTKRSSQKEKKNGPMFEM